MECERPCLPIEIKRCKEKSSKNNVFESRALAKRAIRRIDNGTGQSRIQPYRCRWCGRWHVGKPGLKIKPLLVKTIEQVVNTEKRVIWQGLLYDDRCWKVRYRKRKLRLMIDSDPYKFNSNCLERPEIVWEFKLKITSEETIDFNEMQWWMAEYIDFRLAKWQY